MGIFSWFSANEDGEVVAKTDVQSNGAVNRYEYTVPDHIEKGHGDIRYDSMEDFLNDNPSRVRDKDDPDSIDRRWEGNGYSMTLDDLKRLKEKILFSKYYTSSRLLLKNRKENKYAL